VIRSQLENGGDGLAQLDREAAERREAEDRELERIREQFPDLWAKYQPLPERDQCHRRDPLTWVTAPDAGRSGRHGEVRMPPRSAPPMLMPEGRLSTTDPRGFLEAERPRATVRDVTPAATGSSPLDQRLRRENAELKARLAALEARLNAVAPVVADEAAPVASAEPAAAGMTVEQVREQWRRDAYQAAKRSRANEDGSGWTRTGY
jgi:hypothetical protein